MYNLNVSISGPPLLGVDLGLGSSTPRTPEILNSLIAMTNPLEYSFPGNQQKISQYDSHSSCSGSPLESPAGSNATPSVQQTCSQLIKAGLKLSLEMKRKLSSGDSSGAENSKISKLEESSDDDDESEYKSTKLGLTPEDEDRRRRRRERNKIAATKCRMKKRERTQNLVSESEILENQNIDLKAQVRTLEMERRTLTEMLQSHGPSCHRPDGFQTPPHFSIPIAKYIGDLGLSGDSTTSQIPLPSTPKQPIPPMNTIKFNANLKSKTTAANDTQQSHQQQIQQQQQQQQQQPQQPQQHQQPLSTHQTIVDLDHLTLPEIGFCKSTVSTTDITAMLSPGYCKTSPSDGYALSPDSGFIRSPAEVISSYTTVPSMQHGYIPNCENSNGADSNFALKCELTDGQDSPYTTVQSADRFLFDSSDHFDSGIGDNNQNLKLLQNNNNINTNANNNTNNINSNHHNNNNNNIINNNNSSNNHHHHNNNTSNHNNNNNGISTVIEFNGHCQNFDSHLLKNDFLSHNSEFLSLADVSETQFTDLDSGVTTYTNITSNNSGCLA